MTRREYYIDSINNFIVADEENVLGQLLIHDEFETTDLQKLAWKAEIQILKRQLEEFRGDVIFEYTIPRMGHRVDTVCIIEGIIFLFEFKVGDNEYKKTTIDQVMDYALDLKYFHEESKRRYIVPICVSTKASVQKNEYNCCSDGIYNAILCNENNIGDNIHNILLQVRDKTLAGRTWIDSRYAPTPTIIEAAQSLYRNHGVDDISRNDAGAKNLTITTKAISNIIEDCKKNNRKAICFVTGVPGAGKTLAGLNIANERHHFDEDEHAVFLSGNGPLVDVLQNALAIDRAKREKITKSNAIFDEAQRAWNKESLTDFMKRKKGIPEFNQSEPEFLISIMDRHEDWAVIICLVGGGQEIYNGEAGIQDWFSTLSEKYLDWEIYLSDKITDSEYVGNSDVSTMLHNREYHCISDLHLGVSLRSFRSEKLALFVKCLLDEEIELAKETFEELKKSYPVLITRKFDVAKNWVKKKARGTERYGLLASSEGKRLRAEGIWVPSEINHVGWFLNEKDNVDSSYYLEVAASEFKVQGLEIDYAVLAWDADLRYTSNGFDYFKFRGTKWNHVNQEQRQHYLKNAYRVLMTRARQGLIIYIPEGDEEDPSRLTEYYEGTYQYLKHVGIKEI